MISFEEERHVAEVKDYFADAQHGRCCEHERGKHFDQAAENNERHHTATDFWLATS